MIKIVDLRKQLKFHLADRIRLLQTDMGVFLPPL